MAYAYNNYSPYYTQYNYPQYQAQQMVQPIQQPQNVQALQGTQMSFANQPSSMVWVKNQQEAAMFPVNPNNAVALWDENTAAVYLKQADASGKPSMKIYDLVERTEQPADSPKNEQTQDIRYATKEDVAALAGIVKDFDGIITSIKGDVDKMSETLYGLSGKKKSTKKAESEEETE